MAERLGVFEPGTLDPSYLDLCKRSTRGEYVSEIFYNHQASSDIVLSFHPDHQIHVHKAVIEKASSVLRAAFSGNRSNPTTNQHTIEGFDADVVVTMIKHIYGFELCGIEGHTADEKIKFLLDVYMIGEEYRITSLQMKVIEKIKALLKELYNLRDDEPLRRSIEAIITLHETYKLRDWRPKRDWESRTLLETTARFCTKWQPGCVEDICTPPEDNTQKPLRRYRKFMAELKKAYESFRNDCVRTTPGCLVCELKLNDYCHKPECYCERLAGEWSEEFVDMVESFRPRTDDDEDPDYETEDEDEDEDD